MNSPAARAAEFPFQSPPQDGHGLRQVPVVKRLAEIQGPRFPLQQGQVTHRIVMDILPVPVPNGCENPGTWGSAPRYVTDCTGKWSSIG